MCEFVPLKEITKEVVEAYERHRSEGNYNMVTDSSIIIDFLQVSPEAYRNLIRHYSDYMKFYGVERKS